MAYSKQRMAFKQMISADLHAATLGTLCIAHYEKLENILKFTHTYCLSHLPSGYNIDNKQSSISSTVIPLRATERVYRGCTRTAAV